MNLLPYEINWRNMPLGLGTALRVPVYAWKNWGIKPKEKEFPRFDAWNLEGYRQEWLLTTQQGLNDINKAARQAELGEANDILNQANGAAVVAYYSNKPKGEIRVLDLGSGTGATSMAFLEKLTQKDITRTYVRHVDVAEQSKKIARNKINQTGANFKIPSEPETIREFLMTYDGDKYDIVTANASIHHDANLYPTFSGAYRVLKPGGIMVVTDWHNSVWEHPSRVYKLLDRLEWKTKQRDMKAFAEMYPNAFENSDELNPMLEQANREIGYRFWPTYAKIRTTDEPQFLILEGHRPTEKYMEDMERAGFSVEYVNDFTDDNPYYLRPESELHSRVVAVKRI